VIGEPFRFDSEFQRKLVKLALEDDAFATQASKYITGEMFESDALRWVWTQMLRQREQGRSPTIMVMRDLLRDVPQVLQPRYRTMVVAIEHEVIREEAFIRSRLAEFIQRNIFVGAFAESKRLYNMGQVDQAVTLMQAETQRASTITFDAPDRAFFFSELADRQRRRRREREHNFDYTFATGISRLDNLLDGGLSIGEMGTWIADSKGGKSLFLVHLGVYPLRSMQKRVLMIVLEGSRKMVENRVESLLTGVPYKHVKQGAFDPFTYQKMIEEYRGLQDLLVIRAFTDAWNYNVSDIRAELSDLKHTRGWVPDLITVDYGDLLRSQQKGVSEEQHQRDAFGDLKSLTTMDRGYAIWTASQARRPSIKKEDVKAAGEYDPLTTLTKPVIKARDVADSYNKIRRSDFIGSINQDQVDKQNHEARLWCDLYRDNEAGITITVKQDLSRMVFVDVLDPRNRIDSPEAIAEEETRRRMREANPNLKAKP
jgi:replicative DNA helicase